MAGAFQTSREIFEHPIWQDIPKFRIFFYIVGNAVFAEEGTTVAGVRLKRGQYLRSYRNLIKDLEYIENRSIKKYSLSVISKKIEQLVKEERLKIEESELGTLFTVVNYAQYQGFDHYRKESENGERTEKEQRENAERTEKERSENNNNNVNKDKNVKKDKKKDINPPTPKNPKRIYSEDDKYFKLAVRFHELAFKNAEELKTSHLIKTPDFHTWADTFRLMFEKDKVKDDEIGEVVKFALTDSFYQTIIFSPKNLRKHYMAILTKLRSSKKQPANRSYGNNKPEIPIVDKTAGQSVSDEEFAQMLKLAEETQRRKQSEMSDT
ncbi:hypothetical protein J2T12_005069 [Paenibacillus anaericanus]|uniref:hypothetical protein n=1 Tax=Paenibacillus anaericanus TaxID=170367 RepID=UPI00277FFC31|nr:hypothetical protein [Paenibacillus anaericanus]MDQ0091629.1 hypothetical protein [Paenibacillus anaericanus]